MRVIIVPTYEAMSQRAAQIIAELVRRKPNAVLGLPTGSTPRGMYRHLIRLHREEGLDFSRVTTFNLDEYYGLSATHPQSYHVEMQENFFDHVNIPADQRHLLNGEAPDPEAECAAYEDQIKRAGGIDLTTLGIGLDGHIAFCEPGSSFAGRTSLVALHPQTIADNSRFFNRPEEVPRRALSMGIGTILSSRVCMLLCNGQAKAETWAHFIEGPITPQLPATALHLHPYVVAICDYLAASRLKNWAYYLHTEQELSGQPLLPTWVV
jgi:glucosamine-6-phosphate deaminase